jgi:hypothetical protein
MSQLTSDFIIELPAPVCTFRHVGVFLSPHVLYVLDRRGHLLFTIDATTTTENDGRQSMATRGQIVSNFWVV